MVLTPLRLKGLLHAVPKVHADERGFFVEAFNANVFAEAGITFPIVQHNHSRSKKGVVRGLHFQWDAPLSKYMRVIKGRAFVVAVDIRHDPPTMGQWEGRELNDENKEGIFAPFGFATGFCALSDDTELEYYYDALYNPKGESNIIWNDARIGIAWPEEAVPLLSPRDAGAGTLDEWLSRPESVFIVSNATA
jgi:dTDP-4-dehydrorhamnose 3,5-epimerase